MPIEMTITRLLLSGSLRELMCVQLFSRISPQEEGQRLLRLELLMQSHILDILDILDERKRS